jgi:hypothetical protein
MHEASSSIGATIHWLNRYDKRSRAEKRSRHLLGAARAEYGFATLQKFETLDYAACSKAVASVVRRAASRLRSPEL